MKFLFCKHRLDDEQEATNAEMLPAAQAYNSISPGNHQKWHWQVTKESVESL